MWVWPTNTQLTLTPLIWGKNPPGPCLVPGVSSVLTQSSQQCWAGRWPLTGPQSDLCRPINVANVSRAEISVKCYNHIVTSTPHTSHLPGWWWEPQAVTNSEERPHLPHHELHSDAGASLLPPVRLQRERRRYGEVESRSETHNYYSYIWQPMHCLYEISQ